MLNLLPFKLFLRDLLESYSLKVTLSFCSDINSSYSL